MATIRLIAVLLACAVVPLVSSSVGSAQTSTAELVRAKTAPPIRENSLVRIDPRTGKTAAVVSTGALGSNGTAAFDVAVDAQTVWVYNWQDHSVRAVDTKTNAVDRVVAIGGFAPSTGNALAADRVGAWVLSEKDGHGVISRIPARKGPVRVYRLRYDPVAVALGRGALWVAAKDGTLDTVLRIDPNTGSVRTATRLKGTDIQSIAFGQGAVWVLQSGAITRLDPITAHVTGRVRLPGYQVAQLVAGNGGVWATMRLEDGANALVRVDPQTLRVQRTVRAPAGPSSSTLTHLALGPGAVWWSGSDAGTVWRVDPTRGRIVATIRVTRALTTFSDSVPLGIAAGAGAVWVTVTLTP
jgi:sugar lactone lactonase YvrE